MEAHQEPDRVLAVSFRLPGDVHRPADRKPFHGRPQRRCDRMTLSHPNDPPIARRLHALLWQRLKEE